MKKTYSELERETNRFIRIVGIFKMPVSDSNRSSRFKISMDNVWII